MTVFVYFLIWVLSMLIMYALIRYSIDHSKTVQLLGEIRDLLDDLKRRKIVIPQTSTSASSEDETTDPKNLEVEEWTENFTEPSIEAEVKKLTEASQESAIFNNKNCVICGSSFPSHIQECPSCGFLARSS